MKKTKTESKMIEVWTINFYSDFPLLCFQLPLSDIFSFWFKTAYSDKQAPTSFCEPCILRATAETALGSAPSCDVYQRWTTNSLASPKTNSPNQEPSRTWMVAPQSISRAWERRTLWKHTTLRRNTWTVHRQHERMWSPHCWHISLEGSICPRDERFLKHLKKRSPLKKMNDLNDWFPRGELQIQNL